MGPCRSHRRGSGGVPPGPFADLPSMLYPPAWVDHLLRALYTNQCLFTYGFVFRFLIPLAGEFGTRTQKASFARILCVRCTAF